MSGLEVMTQELVRKRHQTVENLINIQTLRLSRTVVAARNEKVETGQSAGIRIMIEQQFFQQRRREPDSKSIRIGRNKSRQRVEVSDIRAPFQDHDRRDRGSQESFFFRGTFKIAFHHFNIPCKKTQGAVRQFLFPPETHDRICVESVRAQQKAAVNGLDRKNFPLVQPLLRPAHRDCIVNQFAIHVKQENLRPALRARQSLGGIMVDVMRIVFLVFAVGTHRKRRHACVLADKRSAERKGISGTADETA